MTKGMKCYKCNKKIKKGQPYVGAMGKVMCVPCYGPQRIKNIKVRVPQHVSRLKNPAYQHNVEVEAGIKGMGVKFKAGEKEQKQWRAWHQKDVKSVGRALSKRRSLTNPQFYAEKDFYGYLNKHFGQHDAMAPMLSNELRLCYQSLYEDDMDEVKRRLRTIDNILTQRPDLYQDPYVNNTYSVILEAMQSYGIGVEQNPNYTFKGHMLIARPPWSNKEPVIGSFNTKQEMIEYNESLKNLGFCSKIIKEIRAPHAEEIYEEPSEHPEQNPQQTRTGFNNYITCGARQQRKRVVKFIEEIGGKITKVDIGPEAFDLYGSPIVNIYWSGTEEMALKLSYRYDVGTGRIQDKGMEQNPRRKVVREIYLKPKESKEDEFWDMLAGYSGEPSGPAEFDIVDKPDGSVIIKDYGVSNVVDEVIKYFNANKMGVIKNMRRMEQNPRRRVRRLMTDKRKVYLQMQRWLKQQKGPITVRTTGQRMPRAEMAKLRRFSQAVKPCVTWVDEMKKELEKQHGREMNPTPTSHYPTRVYDKLTLKVSEPYLSAMGLDPRIPGILSLKNSIEAVENYVNAELTKIGYPTVSITADMGTPGSAGYYDAWVSLNNAQITGPYKSVRHIALFMPDVIAESTEMEQNPVRYPSGMRKRMIKQVRGTRRQYLQPEERSLLKSIDPTFVTNPKRRRSVTNPTDLTPQALEYYRQRMLGRKLGQPVGAATASWRTNPEKFRMFATKKGAEDFADRMEAEGKTVYEVQPQHNVEKNITSYKVSWIEPLREGTLSWPEYFGMEKIEEERRRGIVSSRRRKVAPGEWAVPDYDPPARMNPEISMKRRRGIIKPYPLTSYPSYGESEPILSEPVLREMTKRMFEQQKQRRHGAIRTQSQRKYPKPLRYGEMVGHVDALSKSSGQTDEEYDKAMKFKVESMREHLEKKYGRKLRVVVSPPHVKGAGEEATMIPATYYFMTEVDW